mgnify:CR=1 FL=1
MILGKLNRAISIKDSETPHSGGDHDTEAAVAGRPDTAHDPPHTAASPSATPRTTNEDPPPERSSTVNCTHARVMVAPCGTATPPNRNPTI